MRVLRALAAFSLLVLTGTAQTTHMVGAGGFPDIDSALAVAAPGDLILVDPGNYSSITANIGVTIRARAPGVSVALVLTNLPAGQSLYLYGLTTTYLTQFTGGRVILDGCSLLKCGVSQSTATLRSCTFPLGFSASNTYVSATNCTFYPVTFTGGLSIEAVSLVNSTFVASSIQCLSYTRPAVRAVGGSVWISDSSLQGVAPFCAVDAPLGRLARCTLSPNCANIPTTGPLLGVRQPSALTTGPFSLTFKGEPNGLVGVFVATGIDNLAVAGFEQPLLLDVSTLFPLDLLVADGLGVASQTWTIPPGLTNWTFFFQAVGTATPLQLSAVVGGLVQ